MVVLLHSVHGGTKAKLFNFAGFFFQCFDTVGWVSGMVSGL